MKVYIIYDRYGRDEFFQIYNICKSIDEVRQVYKQSLVDFCKAGPDDCHSFQCQEVEITNKEFEILVGYMRGNESDEGYNLMVKIHEDCLWCQYPDSNCLFCTDGYSEVEEVFSKYMEDQYPDIDEDSDEWYDIQDEFYSNDDLYETELMKHIDKYFQF